MINSHLVNLKNLDTLTVELKFLEVLWVEKSVSDKLDQTYNIQYL